MLARPRVLVVDDNAPFRRLLMTILSPEDIEVVGTAEDGCEASAAVASLHPDVVLMDYRMPLMDGLTATRLLKQQNDPPRIILLTSDEGMAADAVAAGADAYLDKGHAMTMLAGTIRQIVEGQVPRA